MASHVFTEPMGIDAPWVEWRGGKCPVLPHQGIQIQCRNETRSDAEQSFVETGVFYVWEHRGGTGDIIAYRIVDTTHARLKREIVSVDATVRAIGRS